MQLIGELKRNWDWVKIEEEEDGLDLECVFKFVRFVRDVVEWIYLCLSVRVLDKEL